MKRVSIFLLILALALGLLSGCSGSKVDLDDSDGTLYQYGMPADGDEIAVIHTSLGNITVRFFPEEAPKAVKNFVTHAKDGYYDGLTFYRVINEFMIQSGSPDNTGSTGESIYGGGFENELSAKLHHLHGALAMANSGVANSNTSQWFIVQNKILSSSYHTSLADTQKSEPQYGYTKKVIDAYKKDGGAPWCDQKYTVFGQVIDGLDVVDRIGRMRTDDDDRPVEDVIVERVEITQYHASAN